MTQEPVIEQFDPHTADRDAWVRRHRFRRLRYEEAWKDQAYIADADFEAEEKQTDPHGLRFTWVVRRDSENIGILWAHIARPGCPDYAERAKYLNGNFAVLPNWRKRGIGTRLLAQLREVMREHAKTVLILSTHEEDGHAFFNSIGAHPKSSQVESQLSMDAISRTELASWEKSALSHFPGLRFECFAGRIPESEWPTLLPQMSALMADTPSDSLDRPPLKVTDAGIREWYRNLDRLGGENHVMLLRDADNQLIGYTESVWLPRTANRVFTNMTGVRRDARGRGIAKGLKAAMIRHLRNCHDDIELFITNNASSNSAMLAINKALGFRPVKRWAIYQLDGELIDAYLSSGRKSETAGPILR